MSETDDYKAKVTPAKRRSKFDPHLDGILELQRDGYSLEQICEWLWQKFQVGDLEKKAPSSKQVLSAYLQRRKEQGVTAPLPRASGKAEKITTPGITTPASEPQTPAHALPPLAEALDAEKRAERAKSYVADNTNPFFGRKNK